MLLRDYLNREKIRPYIFAKSIGVASSTIYRNLRGEQRISSKVAQVIEKKTDGQVTRAECVWPEQYVSKENGEEQLRLLPDAEK